MKYKYIVLLIVLTLTYPIQIASAASPIITINDPTPLNNSINTTRTISINITASDADNDNITALLNWNNSLVGWWRMNEAAGGTLVEDFSGYGNNGTWYGSTTSNVTTGKFGNALDFDGSTVYLEGDYVKINHSSILSMNDTFSISFWMKANNDQTNLRIIDKGNNYWIAKDFSENRVLLRINDDREYPIEVRMDNVFDDSWHHIVMTFNRSGNLSGYDNGVLIDREPVPADLGQIIHDQYGTYTNLYFGTNSLQGTFMKGILDDIQIYNRVLSTDEINASYDAGSYRLNATFSGLADGEYNYAAYVQDSTGELNFTKQYVTVNVNIPTTPEISFPANNSRQWNNSINFSWNASIDGDSGDTITYNYSKARDPDFTVAPNGSMTSDLFSGIMPAKVGGATYYLKVRSYDGHQYSPWSNIIEFIENSKPSYTNIVLTNTSVPTLNATFEMVDPEGDTVTNYVRWYKDGTLQPLLNDSTIILGDNLSAGQIWYFEVYGNDGYENSTPLPSNTLVIV